MLHAADITDTDSVLVAGCATGYTAALAARLAGQVTATEVDASLAAKARQALVELGFERVTVRTADVAEGGPADARYDVIVLDGAAELTPAGLCLQLNAG